MTDKISNGGRKRKPVSSIETCWDFGDIGQFAWTLVGTVDMSPVLSTKVKSRSAKLAVCFILYRCVIIIGISLARSALVWSIRYILLIIIRLALSIVPVLELWTRKKDSSARRSSLMSVSEASTCVGKLVS